MSSVTTQEDRKGAGEQPLLLLSADALAAQGRVLDFHGQRTTFITALARAGVPPAAAQKLARHSDINLTLGTYTRLGVAELADEVGKLAKLRPTPPPLEKGNDDEPQPDCAAAADPRLAQLATAWPNLPDHIHQAIMAIVGVVAGNKSDGPTGKLPAG